MGWQENERIAEINIKKNIDQQPCSIVHEKDQLSINEVEIQYINLNMPKNFPAN